MTSIVCNAKEMRTLAKDLGVVSVESQKQFYAGLMEGGEIVAAVARVNAASFPRKHEATTRIADSIVVLRRLTRVKIRAGGDSAPEAAPLEHHGMSGEFRHPLFGTDEWVPQPAEPFLTPAAIESEPAVFALVERKVDDAFRRLGF